MMSKDLKSNNSWIVILLVILILFVAFYFIDKYQRNKDMETVGAATVRLCLESCSGKENYKSCIDKCWAKPSQ